MAVNIAVEGDNLGAIVVGDHNTVVINQPAGAVVLPFQPVRTTRREDPVGLGPRPFPDIVDRVDEDRKSRAALLAVPPVSLDVSGPQGIGKTALLRHVCGDPSVTASFPDGVVYLDGGRQSTDDVLQQLFEAFFDTDRPYKPDETQLRRFLARTSALVMLDGYLAPAAEFDRLLNLARTATFAVAGPQHVLLGEGCAVALDGLRPSDALVLMSRELARPIEEFEIMSARAICTALDGNPLNIILVAAHSRVCGISLTQLAEEVRAAESPEEWLKALIDSKLSDRDRKALAAFAAVDCAPLDDSELAAIGGKAAAETLEGLKDRRLVEFDGKRNRVRRGLVAAIAMSFLGMLPAEAAAQSFLHAAAHSQQATLVEHSDAVLGALKHAALSGKYADVVALAHRVGDAVALSGRWDRWNEMLQQALEAARAAHDSAAEAWALHQIGSRSLALGDAVAAQTALQAAMHIRSGLGDPMALAVTQHNLQVLGVAVVEPTHAAPTATRWGLAGKVAVVVAFVALVGSLGAWVAARPSVTLHAAKPRIARGQVTRLCYTASHVSNVRINGIAAANGCINVHPAHTTIYHIQATGPLGIPIAAQPVRVEVAATQEANTPLSSANNSAPQNNQVSRENQPPENGSTGRNGTAGGNRPPFGSTRLTPVILPHFSKTGSTQTTTTSSTQTTTTSSTQTSAVTNGGSEPCDSKLGHSSYFAEVAPRRTHAPCVRATHTPTVANGGSGNHCASTTQKRSQVTSGYLPAPQPTGTACVTQTQTKKAGSVSYFNVAVPAGSSHSSQSKNTGTLTNPSSYTHPQSPYSQRGSTSSSGSEYLHTQSPYLRTSTPYSRTPTPYSRTPTPYSRTLTPYSHTPFPYPRTPFPYSRTPSPYSRTPLPYTRQAPYANPGRQPYGEPRATARPSAAHPPI
ncbi:MAG: hypothetical protein WCC84_14740 [Candidatus Cybelea sp.]